MEGYSVKGKIKYIVLLGILLIIFGITFFTIILSSFIASITDGETALKQSSDMDFSDPGDIDIEYKGGKFVIPAPKMVRVSSEYGGRVHPVTGKYKFHGGMDLAAPGGSPIVACADGVVVDASYNGGWGNQVRISHGSNIYTLYAHASKLLVTKGQHVKAGQQIAKIGSTGVSTGNHLHIEVWNGGYGTTYRTNPRPYLFGK